MDRIELMLSKYKVWCEKLGIATVSDINKIIDDGKTNQLINLSEIWHEQNISEIAETVRDNILAKKIILISGPSSSGKTSFANKLQLHLKVLGINAVSVSLDNYYYNPSDIPKNADGKPDFEALEAIDYECFNKNMSELIDGKTAVLPVLNFKTWHREEQGKTLRLNDDEIIIVEGLHALNEKITHNIPAEKKYKIYCSALTALSYDDGTRIKSRTTRLIRRIIRDSNFRNTNYKRTIDLWPDVEKGAEKYIFPYTDTADIIFNSSLLYEFAVYKKYLLSVFSDSESVGTHKATVHELLNLVGGFKEITLDMIPRSSLIREFVGGSTLDI